MPDKRITMNKPNVLALLDNRKFSTIRPINPQPHKNSILFESRGIWRSTQTDPDKRWKPKYQVGDRLIVAEYYQIKYHSECYPIMVVGYYLADNMLFQMYLERKEGQLLKTRKFPYRKTSARFMYNSLSRISMIVTKVDVVRPQDMSESDCAAEGVKACCPTIYTACPCGGQGAKQNFQKLYTSIYGLEKWKQNLYHWRYQWKEIEIK